MFENVSKELLEKAKQAKTKEEALAILKEGGVELTEDDLKGIAGGEEGEGDFCTAYCMIDKCPPYSRQENPASESDQYCGFFILK